ncbi:MAG TPA: glycosyl transferase family 1, partial [Nitrospiraceae bacterium]|nr:glycosyl transferase family 1 [Nitrospiraceae bacterium]
DRVKLAGAITEILQDKTLAQRMGIEGRRRVSTLYNWDHTCKVFSDIITGLIEKRKG